MSIITLADGRIGTTGIVIFSIVSPVMVIYKELRVTALVMTLLFSITGCALPSYKLPAGYSGSYDRYLDAHDSKLPKMVTDMPILTHEPLPTEVQTSP